MERYAEPEPINLGLGGDISIANLSFAIKEITGYSGKLEFALSKPDGMPVKVLDSSKLKAMGWRSRVSFRDALQATYNWYRKSIKNQ